MKCDIYFKWCCGCLCCCQHVLLQQHHSSGKTYSDFFTLRCCKTSYILNFPTQATVWQTSVREPGRWTFQIVSSSRWLHAHLWRILRVIQPPSFLPRPPFSWTRIDVVGVEGQGVTQHSTTKHDVSRHSTTAGSTRYNMARQSMTYHGIVRHSTTADAA